MFIGLFKVLLLMKQILYWFVKWIMKVIDGHRQWKANLGRFFRSRNERNKKRNKKRNVLLERGELMKKWRNEGVATFLLLYSSVKFTVYLGKVRFLLNLYCTKTWYDLYISDPFWSSTKNLDCFIYLSLEYTEK